ncbi:urea transporter [Microcystis elabens FACHB-917]|nr:urea transporter [Microcystis elabens FACHB-917]
MGGIFHAPTRRSLGAAALAALTASLLNAPLGRLMPLGLPVLTLPFIVATLATLLVVRRALPTVVPVALHAILTPEEHRQRYLVTRRLLNDFRSRLRGAVGGAGWISLVPSADPALLGRFEELFERLPCDRDGQLSRPPCGGPGQGAGGHGSRWRRGGGQGRVHRGNAASAPTPGRTGAAEALPDPRR